MNTEQKIGAEAIEKYPVIIERDFNPLGELNTDINEGKRAAYIAGRSKGLEREKELEEALRYLVNDVRNKPNDTRYATALKKANNILNKQKQGI